MCSDFRWPHTKYHSRFLNFDQFFRRKEKKCISTFYDILFSCAVCFHTELPLVITGSEDGTVRLWHSATYRLESSLNYGLERVWTVACLKGCNNIALGSVVIFFLLRT